MVPLETKKLRLNLKFPEDFPRNKKLRKGQGTFVMTMGKDRMQNPGCKT